MALPDLGSLVYTSNTPDGIVTGAIGEFMLISQASNEYVVQWSAIGDITDWPTPATADARAKQAGQETLSSEYGKITGITGGDFYGYIFQQRAVTKFTYVGGDVVWTINTFERARGCFDYNRFWRVDDLIFFQSEFGHHALIDDQIVDIGHGVVDDLYKPMVSVTTGMQSVVANPGITTVFFEDNNLAYNYKTKQWTRLPALDGRGYYPIDSDTGVIGQIVFSGTSVDLQTSTGGVTQAARITTGEYDINQGGRTFIQGVRPLTDGGSPSVRVGARNNITDPVSWSASATPTTRTGIADFRSEGRYQRVEITISDAFDTIIGADVYFQPAGFI